MKRPYRTLRCIIQSDTCAPYTHCGDGFLEVTLAAKGESGVHDLAKVRLDTLADGSVKLTTYDWVGRVVDSTEFEI